MRNRPQTCVALISIEWPLLNALYTVENGMAAVAVQVLVTLPLQSICVAYVTGLYCPKELVVVDVKRSHSGPVCIAGARWRGWSIVELLIASILEPWGPNNFVFGVICYLIIQLLLNVLSVYPNRRSTPNKSQAKFSRSLRLHIIENRLLILLLTVGNILCSTFCHLIEMLLLDVLTLVPFFFLQAQSSKLAEVRNSRELLLLSL